MARLLDFLRLQIDMQDLTQQGRQSVVNSLSGIQAASARTASSLSRLTGVAAGVAVALGGGEFTRILAEYDKLNGSLRTVTGSLENARIASEFLRDFSTRTPFELDEVTQAFIKLKSLGFDASAKSLTQIGNAAASFNVTLADSVDAIAAAARGEFDPIEKFGIQIKKNGDQLQITFRGVTQTVRNTTAEIQAAFGRISDGNFAGGISNQIDTIGGKLSNLGDAFKNFVDFIGNLGVRGALKKSFEGATDFIGDLQKRINALLGSGLQAELDAAEIKYRDFVSWLAQLQRDADDPIFGRFRPRSEIDDQIKKIREQAAAIVELKKKKADLDAKDKEKRGDITKGVTPTAPTPSESEQKAAADERKRALKEQLDLELANIKARLDAKAIEVKQAAELAEAEFAHERAAATGNAQALADIDGRARQSKEAFARESARIDLARSDAESAALNKYQAEQERIIASSAEIAQRKSEIAQLDRLSALAAQTAAAAEAAANADRARQLDDLVSGYDRVQATILKIQRDAAQAVELGASDAQLRKIVTEGNAQVEALKKPQQEAQKSSDAFTNLGFALNSSLESAITSGQTLGGVFQGLTQDFAKLALRSGLNLLVEQLQKVVASAFEAQAAVSAVGSAGGGGGGGILGLLGGLIFGSAEVHHAGGTVGSGGGTRRLVPAMALAGAPRLHSGGGFGLRSDERAAILQTGERVIPRGGSVGGETSVQIIDQRGANAPAMDVQRSRNGNQEQIKVFVRQAMIEAHDSGLMDPVMARNHGAKRPAR